MMTQAFTYALMVAMVIVIVSDVVRYIIPNWLNASILALYIVAVALLPSDPLLALAAAGIVFVVGLASFALGLMGGGDVKLLFVLTLWTGWHEASVQFLFMTAIVGGLLVLVVLPLRKIIPPLLLKKNPDRTLPRILTRGQPVPYGIAIAGAFLWVLLSGNVPMLGALSI